MLRQEWFASGLAGCGALLLAVAMGGMTTAGDDPAGGAAAVEPVPLQVDRISPETGTPVVSDATAPIVATAETDVSTFQVEPLPVTRVMPAAIPAAGTGAARRTPALSTLKAESVRGTDSAADFTTFVSHSDEPLNVRPAVLTRQIDDPAAGETPVQSAVIDGATAGTQVQTVGYRRFYSPWRYSWYRPSYYSYYGYPYYRALYSPRYYYGGYYGWGFPYYRSYYYGSYWPNYTSWYYQPYAAYSGWAYTPVAYTAAYVGAYGYGIYGYGGYGYGGYCGW